METVCCIKCGARGDEYRIALDLDSGDIHCENCEEAFTVADVERVVKSWERLLPWLKQNPIVRAKETVE